ncbi:MAG TPA: hypothetical protein PLL23_15470 [Chitinophagaceae bacterium]|nr:hypothetical protein [Chitinophagaceae bacterium]
MRNYHLPLFYILIIFIFGSFNKLPQSEKLKPASAIVFIKNNTSNSTINSLVIGYSQPHNNQYTVTVNVTITPGSVYELNLGNITEYISLTLNLSNSISGSIKVVDVDDYFYCPELACNIFTNTNSPSTYYYQYTPRWLFLTNVQACPC